MEMVEAEWRSNGKYTDSEGTTASEPGDKIVVDRERFEALREMSMAVESTKEEGSEPEPYDAPDLDELTKTELRELAEAVGVEVTEIEGTGTNGHVLKGDIREAVEHEVE